MLEISIHALREEGDRLYHGIRFSRLYFYPRPPRGGRLGVKHRRPSRPKFLSTPSARRATNMLFILSAGQKISIHALREEGDQQPRQEAHTTPGFLSTPSARRATASKRLPYPLEADFYPRPPRGGRPCIRFVRSDGYRFLSTPSARRATVCPDRCVTAQRFLSTPSARRATATLSAATPMHAYFYPRPPRGGRPRGFRTTFSLCVISIHALREEGDL